MHREDNQVASKYKSLVKTLTAKADTSDKEMCSNSCKENLGKENQEIYKWNSSPYGQPTLTLD